MLSRSTGATAVTADSHPLAPSLFVSFCPYLVVHLICLRNECLCLDRMNGMEGRVFPRSSLLSRRRRRFAIEELSVWDREEERWEQESQGSREEMLTLSHRRQHEQVDGRSSSPVAHDSDAGRISAELVDVLLNPV